MKHAVCKSDVIKHRFNCAFKSVVFILVAAVLFIFVSRAFTVDQSDLQYPRMNGIYTEEENSLDAVYIGSSNAYAYWNPLIAWEEYGITVYQYGTSNMSFSTTEYLVKEARKTQPNAVYVININALDDIIEDKTFHYMLDNMPFSVNKMQMAKFMVETNGISFSDSMEYFFPILRYHSRWFELSSSNFIKWNNNIKNSSRYSMYLSRITNISEDYQTDTKKAAVSEHLTECLNSLLDYCDEENIRAVFVTVPQAREDIKRVQQYNTFNELISSRGYPVIDLLNNIEATGLNLNKDFYNLNHTNIHGSAKFTHYMAEYLIEMFGFEDKRENPDYSSWNEALGNYLSVIGPYILDFELDTYNRDYSIANVSNLAVSKTDEGNTLKWEASTGADGYLIYRKIGGSWSKIGETESLAYTDTKASKKGTYTYTAVPFTETAEGRFYGDFSYKGVSVNIE